MLFYTFILIGRVNVNFGDDIDYYLHALDQTSVGQYLLSRYYGWSSRLIVDLCVPFFVRYVWLWKTLTVLAAVSIYRSIVRICLHEEDCLPGRYAAFLLVLLYPFFNDMQSAGWVATTVNYFWTACALLHCIRCLVDWKIRDCRISLPGIALFTAAFFFCTDQEQSAVIFAMLLFSCLVLRLIRQGKPDLFLSVFLILNAGIIAFEMTCPGNAARLAANTDYWMPTFSDFGIIDKAYMGIYAVYKYFICGNETLRKPVLMEVLLLTAMAGWVLLCGNKAGKTVMTMLTAAALLIQTGFVLIKTGNYPQTGMLCKFLYDPGLIERVEFAAKRSCMPIIITALIFAVIFLLAARLPGENRLLCILFILCGLASEAVMGFSPTIWASSERTAVFSFFLFAAAGVLFVRECVKSVSETRAGRSK